MLWLMRPVLNGCRVRVLLLVLLRRLRLLLVLVVMVLVLFVILLSVYLTVLIFMLFSSIRLFSFAPLLPCRHASSAARLSVVTFCSRKRERNACTAVRGMGVCKSIANSVGRRRCICVAPCTANGNATKGNYVVNS